MRYSPPTYPDHGESNTVKKRLASFPSSAGMSLTFFTVYPTLLRERGNDVFHQVVFYNHFYNCKLYDPHCRNVQCNFIVSDCKKVIAVLKEEKNQRPSGCRNKERIIEMWITLFLSYG
jgi:hypothetical protein